MSSNTFKFLLSIYRYLSLWNGSETQLLDFITRLNSRHPTTKFGFKHSKSSIEFLREEQITKQQYTGNVQIGEIFRIRPQHTRNH